MMNRLLVLAAVLAISASETLRPSCNRTIYCDSKILHHVQLSRIFPNRQHPDSKTFVDFPLKTDEKTIIAKFDELLNSTNNKPTEDEIEEFVNNYFVINGTELDKWSPPDYKPDPEFLNGIRDPELKQFGKQVHEIWPELGRKVKAEVIQNPDRYSFLPVTNGFIIPGGRFTELYYWDTYWIIEGLLVSGMQDTVKGMISNLIELLKAIGHVPNGSRWYYQERSQPPLLSAMMDIYIKRTGDIAFLKQNIDALKTELHYWLDNQRVTFTLKDRTYTLLRYYVPSKGPRPESYYEDYTNANKTIFDTEERKQEFYSDIKSGAESGWDFSSRWFIDRNGTNGGSLTDIHTKYIIPVDLNSIFANALENMKNFQTLVGSRYDYHDWGSLARQWRADIDALLWDDTDGVWYDYDLKDETHRKYFYPTNVAPLWMKAVDEEKVLKYTPRVIKYLRQSTGLDQPGGIPTSLSDTGEQWDFPNAWPPLISVVSNALEAMNTPISHQMAFNVAQTWVRACYIGFKESKHMYEKYDATDPGKYGFGGEYQVQNGFGWSNGVVLEFLAKYGEKLTVNDDPNDEAGEESNSGSDSFKVLELLEVVKSPNNPNSPIGLKLVS